MVIFHSYVSLPKGTLQFLPWHAGQIWTTQKKFDDCPRNQPMGPATPSLQPLLAILSKPFGRRQF